MQSYYIVPSVNDRIAQAVMLNAYEPVFECDFESNSFGFRPGRSCHDAVEAVWIRFSTGNDEYVLDADIKGAFDNISHNFIMNKIGELPGRELIRAWLKAGYVEFGQINPTESGTPQGGICSPLLANIALDGLEEFLGSFTDFYEYNSVSRGKPVIKKQKRQLFGFCRYADDFLVTCRNQESLKEIQPQIERWLALRGLAFNQEKTKIVSVKQGFNFLGFNFRHFEAPYLREGSLKHKNLLKKKQIQGKKKVTRNSVRAIGRDEKYYSCIVSPEKEKVKQFLRDVQKFLDESGARGLPQVIKLLNSKLRGWANYYRTVCSKQTFNYVDYMVWEKFFRFLIRRHPNKGKKWIKRKYYTSLEGNNWTAFTDFQDRSGKTKRMHLIAISKYIPIIRHIKVKGTNSPCDPELQAYWSKRTTDKGKILFAKDSKYQIIATNQKGLCPICDTPITDEPWDVHHNKPIKDGGTNSLDNLMIAHKVCHQSKYKGLHYKDDSLESNLVDQLKSKKILRKKVTKQGCKLA